MGNVVGYGTVRFVADTDDHWQYGGGNGSGHEFVVEGNQIGAGAAAAHQRNRVDVE